MRTKRKAIAIIKGDHVPIREQPPLQRMEFSEATAVILDDDPRLPIAIAHLHDDFRKNSRLLASIDSVVHRLFDGDDQRLGGRIKPKEVAVLEKEL